MKTRRAIAIKFNNGKEDLILELSTAAAIHTDKKMIILEERKDGTFMLNFTASLIDDFSQIESFQMIRDDNE